MPELPEVETISNDLREHLYGNKITNVEFLDNRNLRNISEYDFIDIINNNNIINIYRKGKNIIWDLSNNFSIVFHLRMTGKFVVTNNPLNSYKHNMVLFQTNKTNIIFSDIRKFATITVDKTDSVQAKNSGIDPVSKIFTFDSFNNLTILYSKLTCKSFLLNQKIISGIGNIYASEILFDSKISPSRTVSSLLIPEKKCLYESILKILKEAILHRGTTFSDYRDSFNKKGSYQNFLKVYNKNNTSCQICKTNIEKIKQNGRSTFFCKNCQK
jgi:formamidopyrimidine-DNA glycosylase